MARSAKGAIWFLSALWFVVLPSFAANVDINIPTSPPNGTSRTAVNPNFLGISLELANIDTYFGTSSSSLSPLIRYLSYLSPPGTNYPLRLRLGGNSMDFAVFVPNQMEVVVRGQGNSTDYIPCTIGPATFEQANTVKSLLPGGINWLVGLSLHDPTNPNIINVASAAENFLGSDLDAFILGNEPDLYTSHGFRPDIANYTIQDYFREFGEVISELHNSSSGDLLKNQSGPMLSGPSICCRWDLNALLGDGYIQKFSDELKYISVQHYPQNNCGGKHKYGLDYYLNHKNIQALATWQQLGINNISSNDRVSQKVIMSEFNTASCGGIPGISDTFTAALWTVDQALQMATHDPAGQRAGYHSIYLHTRELNTAYSLFLPWPGAETFKARPQFYSHLVIRAALTPFSFLSGGVSDGSGSWVTEIDLDDGHDTQAAYAIFDVNQYSQPSSVPNRLVFINYEDNATTFNIQSPPRNVSESWNNLSVVYLSGPSLDFSYDNNPSSHQNVTWGGRTLVNGTWSLLSSDQSWVGYNQTMPCRSGCQVTIPDSGVVVVYVGASLPLDQTGVKVAANSSGSFRIATVFWVSLGFVMSCSVFFL